jgi:hypothetical protein
MAQRIARNTQNANESSQVPMTNIDNGHYYPQSENTSYLAVI